MGQSHKQIMQQSSSSFLPYCFPDPESAFSHPGSSGRERKGPLLEAHQMQKLGHSVPDGSQAPVAVGSLCFSSFQDQTLALWGHAANAPVDFKEGHVGI